MSRIGKQPIPLPEGVEVEIRDREVEVKGPKGILAQRLPDGVGVAVSDRTIVVTRDSDASRARAMHGLTRALVANMVEGVSRGYERVLEIVGTGYRAEEAGKGEIKFTLGYSHPIVFTLPEGVSAKIEERGTKLTLSAIDKQLLGETAARIRRLRPPDAYKGKGIRYAGEVLRLKAGKSGVKK